MLNNYNLPSRSKHEQSGAVTEKPAELFFLAFKLDLIWEN